MEYKKDPEKYEEDTLKILEWDSVFFGFKVAQLDCSNLNEKILKNCVENARKEKITCIYCLADPKYKKILESYGFYFIDEKIELIHNLNASFKYSDDIEVDLAQEKDIPQIKKITKNAFKGITRFYKDPHFNKKKVDELYEIWVDKLMKNENSTIIVIRDNNEIVAFNGISIKNGEGRIELIAVDKKYKNQGYGEKIINLAQKCFKNVCFMKSSIKINEINVKTYSNDIELIKELENTGFKVKVTTQDKNIPAKKLYTKMGFINNEKRKYWFHWWNEDA